LVQHVLAAADEDGVPAFGEKCRRRRLAYAGSGAGDDCSLAVGGFGHSVFLPVCEREHIANAGEGGKRPNKKGGHWRPPPIRGPAWEEEAGPTAGIMLPIG